MRAFFRHIRQQPQHVRERYALGIASTFTGVVVLLWAVARFDTVGMMVPTSIAEEERTAFSTLVKNSKEQFAKLKTSLASSASSSSETNAAALPQAQDPATIILSPEDLSVLAEKASTTEPTPPAPTYNEVLIGTTSASTTLSASSSTSR